MMVEIQNSTKESGTLKDLMVMTSLVALEGLMALKDLMVMTGLVALEGLMVMMDLMAMAVLMAMRDLVTTADLMAMGDLVAMEDLMAMRDSVAMEEMNLVTMEDLRVMKGNSKVVLRRIMKEMKEVATTIIVMMGIIKTVEHATEVTMMDRIGVKNHRTMMKIMMANTIMAMIMAIKDGKVPMRATVVNIKMIPE